MRAGAWAGVTASVVACVPTGALETGRVVPDGQTTFVVGFGYGYAGDERIQFPGEKDGSNEPSPHPVPMLFFRPRFGIGHDAELDLTFTVWNSPSIVGGGVYGGAKLGLVDEDHASSAIGLRTGIDIRGGGGVWAFTFVAHARAIGAAHADRAPESDSALYLAPSVLFEHVINKPYGDDEWRRAGSVSYAVAAGVRQGISDADADKPRALYLEGEYMITPRRRRPPATVHRWLITGGVETTYRAEPQP